MNKIIFDTNIWVALFNTADSQHEKAKKLVESLEETIHGFVVTNYIDLECISVLLKRASFQASEQWIEYRKKSSYIRHICVSEEHHQNIVELFVRLKNKKLSFIDVSLFYFAQLGFQIFTFDANLEKFLKTLKISL